MAKKKALIVEDDPRRRKPLERQLSGQFELEFFTNIKDAKAKLKNGLDEGLALLVIDMMLPRDEVAAGKLISLENERLELFRKLANCSRESDSPDKTKVDSIREDIHCVDKKMQQHMLMDGGLEVIKACCGSPVKALTVPTLFITARKSDELKEEALRLVECGEFLNKPVTDQMVKDALDRLFPNQK
jgi:CheY-like chemotaxis protein